MKLLIKIYFENINPYDLTNILNVFKSNIIDDDNIKIHLMTNNSDFDFEPYDFSYLNTDNIPTMINHKLNELNWDIVIPLFNPCIPIYKFDEIIKKYKNKFPKLNGVLWLNDGIQQDINIYPVIGKNYYKNFGYIFNPVYNKKNFGKEFTDILKYNNKYYYDNKIYFKSLNIKSDDDNIYELRKKLKFGLI